ncbi:MAG: hypothetical protein K1Y01_16010 [Vicinamibacteria bacterium]|nr:hypothetical protein [Vicinamibacteria bacterium]
MKHLLVAALAGLLALPLFLVGAFIVIASGSSSALWLFPVVILVVFAAGLKWLPAGPPPIGPAIRIRNGMGALLLGCLAGAFAAFFLNLLAARLPAQKEIAAALAAHRADFEALREMATTDGIEATIDFGSSFSRPTEPGIFKRPREAGLSDERASRYRELMTTVDCPRIDVWPDGSVHFLVKAWGTAWSGFRVAITWSAAEPSPLLPTIDGFPGTRPKGGANHAYSRLDGSWYAYVIW